MRASSLLSVWRAQAAPWALPLGGSTPSGGVSSCGCGVRGDACRCACCCTAAAARAPLHTSSAAHDGTGGGPSSSERSSSSSSSSSSSTSSSPTSGGDEAGASPSVGGRGLGAPIGPSALVDPVTGYRVTQQIAGVSAPPQQLKVRLREDAEADAVGEAAGGDEGAPDLFSLSRELVSGGDGPGGDGGAAAGAEGAAGAGRRALGPDEQLTLSKLVGCLTKEGKRSRAQRVVSDALHIINAQLRKAGGGGSGGATAAAGGKGA